MTEHTVTGTDFTVTDTDAEADSLSVSVDTRTSGAATLTVARMDGDFYAVATDVDTLEALALDILATIEHHRATTA